eukprot:jgi/Mesvir1/25614/Mv01841-RA.1
MAGPVPGIKPGENRELLARFEVQKFLGKGSYGSVFRVKRKSDGKIYAVKETNVKQMSQVERDEAVNEIRLLASITHENVVNYHEAFLDGNKLCVVMEYAPNGDISHAIRRRAQQGKHFPEELIWSYFIQVCYGLRVLHQMRIIHRDIKSANILRMDNERVKIGDLGVAKLLKGGMAKTQIGTPHYMPPEVWRNQPYSFSSDVYALGCVVYEMATFNVPFEARSLNELRQKVLRGVYPPIPSMYSSDLSHLLKALMDPDQTSRPKVEDVLRMPSVKKRLHLAPEDTPAPQHAPGANPHGNMLDTIKVPKNLRLLKEKLPQPSYPSDYESADGEGGEAHEPIPGLEHLEHADAGGMAVAGGAYAPNPSRFGKPNAAHTQGDDYGAPPPSGYRGAQGGYGAGAGGHGAVPPSQGGYGRVPPSQGGYGGGGYGYGNPPPSQGGYGYGGHMPAGNGRPASNQYNKMPAYQSPYGQVKGPAQPQYHAAYANYGGGGGIGAAMGGYGANKVGARAGVPPSLPPLGGGHGIAHQQQFVHDPMARNNYPAPVAQRGGGRHGQW